MRKLAVVAVALLLGGLALAKVPQPKRFNVGMKTPAKVVRGASTVTSSSTLTVARQTVHMANDGATEIDLVYITPGGQQIVTRQAFVAAGCGAVTDAFGNVLAATTPAALCTAITSFAAQLDVVIGSAASGNKLNL